MKLKSRRGSAIFTLVLLFSILILMSTGVLALTNMAAQTRAIEKKRKIALYASETTYSYLEEELKNAFLAPTKGIYVTSLRAANTAAGEYTELLRLLLQRKFDAAEAMTKNGGTVTAAALENFDDNLSAYLNAEAYNSGRTSSDIYSLDYHLFQYLSNAYGNSPEQAAESVSNFSVQLGDLIGSDTLPGTLDAELGKATRLTYEGGGEIDLTTDSGIEKFIKSGGKFTAAEDKVRDMADGFYVALFNERANKYIEDVLESGPSAQKGGYTELENRINGLAGLPADPADPNFINADDNPNRVKLSLILPGGKAEAEDFREATQSEPEVNAVSLTFRSEKPGDDGRTATITASYRIKRPDFQSQGLYTILGEVNVNKNILQRKALAAAKGITVTGTVSEASVNGAVFSGSDLTIESGAALNISDGDLYAGTEMTLADGASFMLANGDARIESGGITLSGGAEFNADGRTVTAGGSITLADSADSSVPEESAELNMNNGVLLAGDSINLGEAATLSMNGGTLLTKGGVNLEKYAKFNMKGGELYAGGIISSGTGGDPDTAIAIGEGAQLNMAGADASSTLVAEGGSIVNKGNGAIINFAGEKRPDPSGFFTAGSLEANKAYADADYNITGNVYTGRNIILDGANSWIEIAGDYYGYSEGGLGGNYDTGSRIAVNDIDAGSKLTITGDKVLIAGTAWVTGLQDSVDANGNPEGLITNGLYQTGESVAIKGNYAAYGFPILSDSTDPYYFENMTFKKFAPLYAVYSMSVDRDNDGTKEVEILTGMQKALYFAAAAEEYEKAQGAAFKEDLINTDIVTLNVPPEKIITNGVYIDKRKTGGVGEHSAQNDVQDEATAAKKRVTAITDRYKSDYKAQTAQLAPDETIQYITSHGFNDAASISSKDAKDNLTRYNAYAAENKIIFAGGAGTVTIKGGTDAGVKEDPQGSGNYTITVSGDAASGAYFANIILANGGDVFIEGGLTLVGSIISNGRITVNGDSKIFSDEDRVLELLALDKFDNITARKIAGTTMADGKTEADYNPGPIANQFHLGSQTSQSVYRRIGVDSYYRPPDGDSLIRLTAWE